MSPETTRNPNLDRRSPSVAAAGGEAWRRNLGREAIDFPRGADWWTGPAPDDPGCPGRRADGTIGGLPPPDLARCSREEVRRYFDNGWVLTELLFASLRSEEGFFRPPYHDLRHPLIFYYTHPAALYVNKLRVAGLLAEPVNPDYEQLFETGVDEMSWDDLSKNEMEWPSVSECREYRRKVYRLVADLIAEHPGLADGHPPVAMDDPLWALFLGFEHERIHIETTSVLMRELPVELVARPEGFPRLHPSARPLAPDAIPPRRVPASGRDWPENPLVPVPAGRARIGKDRDFPTFGWDNEYGAREPSVEAFASSRYLVTNGEFHAFVAAGGYRQERWWTKEGFRWRNFRNVKWPTFWVPIGPQGSHQYCLRTLFELVEMPWDWPAVVNAHEARAYCAWRTEREGRAVALRLPTEAEHHRLRAAADLLPAERLASPEIAGRLFADPGINASLRHGSESPVAGPDRPFTDVFGNVWHWLEDDFHPLAGFRIHPYYDDFSTPCFDGQHKMILGGSFISLGDEATAHERFHFRPHFYQHAGFRVVDPLRAGNDGAVVKIAGPKEGEGGREASWEGRVFAAFAPPRELLPARFSVVSLHREYLPARIAHFRREAGAGARRALDVGCGPGGITRALAAEYGEVIGADLDCAAIEGARRLLPADLAGRVSFRQTDAGALPADWVGFDLVLASRVLSRMVSPKALLGRLGGARGLVKPGGLCVLADEFAWEEAVTPRELWFGGDHESLAPLLGPDFECVDEGWTFAVERPRPGRLVGDELRVTIWRRRA
jgi:5-histidylcysteine sulfoxide synthase